MWLYIIVFILIGFLLLFSELFVPGGILGFLGFSLMGISVWLSFSEYGSDQGLYVLLFCLVGVLLFLVIAVKVLPYSFIGRQFILGKSSQLDEGYSPSDLNKSDLVGKTGVAESTLRPAGIALIDGERYDVVTEGEYVSPRTQIKVLRVDSNRIVVGSLET